MSSMRYVQFRHHIIRCLAYELNLQLVNPSVVAALKPAFGSQMVTQISNVNVEGFVGLSIDRLNGDILRLFCS